MILHVVLLVALAVVMTMTTVIAKVIMAVTMMVMIMATATDATVAPKTFLKLSRGQGGQGGFQKE